MNGISPAPARTEQTKVCAFARRAPNMPSRVGAITIPTPDRKPCASSWRRVIGRG